MFTKQNKTVLLLPTHSEAPYSQNNPMEGQQYHSFPEMLILLMYHKTALFKSY